VKEKEIKIIEVKSEIGAGTRGASLGVEAMKIASLDLKSDLFRQYDSIEVENVNELLFDGAKHAYAKFIDGVLIMEERVCLEVYETIFDEFFPLIMAGDHSTSYGTISGIKKANPKKRLGVVWIDAHADIHTLIRHLPATCMGWHWPWHVTSIISNARSTTPKARP